VGFLKNLLRPIDVNPGVSRHALEGVVWPVLPGTNLVYQSTYSQALALSVGAVYRARQMVADVVASLPVRVGDSLVPAPSVLQSAQGFIEETVLSLLDYGDAYWQVSASGDIRVLPYDEVNVSWNQDRTKRIYSFRQQTLRTRGSSPPLVVLSINRGVTDLIGYGPMRSERIKGLIAEQRWSQEFFVNGTEPTGLLTAPGTYTKDEAELIMGQWNTKTGRAPRFLSGGLEYKSMSFSATDSDWVDTHVIGVNDVATLFGIPANLLNTSPTGQTSSLTYANVSSIYEGWYRASLYPTYIKRVSEAWGEILGSSVVFDPEELFLASLQERTFAAATLVNAGFEPEDSVDVVGLPPVRHTGKVPTTVQQEGQG